MFHGSFWTQIETEEQKQKIKNKQIFDVLEKANKLQPTDHFPEDYIQTVYRILWEKLSIGIFHIGSVLLLIS